MVYYYFYFYYVLMFLKSNWNISCVCVWLGKRYFEKKNWEEEKREKLMGKLWKCVKERVVVWKDL